MVPSQRPSLSLCKVSDKTNIPDTLICCSPSTSSKVLRGEILASVPNKLSHSPDPERIRQVDAAHACVAGNNVNDRPARTFFIINCADVFLPILITAKVVLPRSSLCPLRLFYSCSTAAIICLHFFHYHRIHTVFDTSLPRSHAGNGSSSPFTPFLLQNPFIAQSRPSSNSHQQFTG